MKKKITLFVAAMVASSSMVTTGFAANFKDSTDVPWVGATQIIDTAVSNGLLSGYEDNTFRARNSVTYAETMQMVYKVMQMTGKAKAVDAGTISKYKAFLDAYNVPIWSQTAVSYGLENGILETTDIAKFVTNGKNNAATREDVAVMFGRAVSSLYLMENMATEAAKFTDYYRISDAALQYVGVLSNMGIVNGDDNNNFLPKNNINRAEMAVMMNKTFDTLKEGGETSTGKITRFESNGDTYEFVVTMDSGDKLNLAGSASKTIVYDGDTTKTISLSRLDVGDRVSVQMQDYVLISLRLLDGTSSSKSKYDVTGYINSFKGNTLSIENENTNETESYSIDPNGCVYYIEDDKVSKSELQDELANNDKEYAYVGLLTDVESETAKDNDKHYVKDTIYITEMRVEFVDEYSRVGIATDLSSDSLGVRIGGVKTSTTMYLAESCDLYIGDDKATQKEAEEFVDSGTVYVKFTTNSKNKVTKAIFAEDDFGESLAISVKTYTVEDLNNRRIILKSGSDKTEYTFGSTNPVSNISFYIWDSTDKEWDEVNLTKAEDKYIEWDKKVDDKGNDIVIYGRIEKNNGGKIKGIYISDKKNAWALSEDSSDFAVRKGTVSSYNGKTLTFKTSSEKYTLLARYNANIGNSDNSSTITAEDPNDETGKKMVKNPLVIANAPTSSLTAFEKLAGNEDVALYVEARVNGSNVIQSIDARLTKMTGTLVEFGDDSGDQRIKLTTSDGSTITLLSPKKPKIVDEFCKPEDLENHSYVGSELELTFDSDGDIKTIEVLESGLGAKSIKGIVTASGKDVKVSGSSKTYSWPSRSNIEIHNNSMDTTSLDRIKELIGDDSVEVYASFIVTDNNNIQRITVTVKEAEGKFQEYKKDDHTLRIITDDGYKFTFNVVKNPDIDIDDIAESKLNSKAVGKSITLEFNEDGLVEGFGN